jgi:hypothetical protein
LTRERLEQAKGGRGAVSLVPIIAKEGLAGPEPLPPR